jgi:ribonucleoside-diphosphate reductase alpha chain
MNKALHYFNNNELAAAVWLGKYALKNKKNEIIEETPDDMHWRMAREFARIENQYPKPLSEESIYNRFKKFSEIIPQGSVMALLGNPYQIGSLSNCIVLPQVFDSYGGIMYADQQLAQLMKRRCGVGLDISTLRPSGTPVSNAAQTSTGSVSFMPRFSNTCREVAQDGRRGAEMITQHINHPDSKAFATIKQDLSKVTGANISLLLTDEFMDSVEKDEAFIHRFPVTLGTPDISETEDMPFDELQTWANAQVKKVRAKDLWNTIVSCAHKSAEPGLIFWDKQHIYSTSSMYPGFKNISTNPCSEIAMNNDSCRLMAANLMSCVTNPFTKKAKFDHEKWYQVCYDQLKLMDDLVDLELESIDRILDKIEKDDEPEHIKEVERNTWIQLRKTGEQGRRTGSGLTGLGDALAALGLKYDSNKAIKEIDAIMRTKLKAELDCGTDMAIERGSFPIYDADLEAMWSENPDSFFYMLRTEFPYEWERMQLFGRRNISWSTLAPTGSLSLLALLSGDEFGTTSGMEPMFNTEPNVCWHIRRKKINPNDKDARVDFVDDSGDKWQEFKIFHAGFRKWFEIRNPDADINQFTTEELQEIVKDSPYGGSGSSEIDWLKRVDIQAVIQKYITHSISSTINLPSNVSIKEVSDIYFYAWKKGLKGITVYRDGSRTGVLVSETKQKPNEFDYKDAAKRPKELDGELHIVSVKGQRYGVIVGSVDNKPYEIFAFECEDEQKAGCKGKIIKVKKGHYTYKSDCLTMEDIQSEAIRNDEQVLTRLISGMLRHGAKPQFVMEQIDKCNLEIVSFGKAISRVLKRYVKDEELEERYICKDCSSTNIKIEEGCATCLDCGSSKCS